MKIDLLHNKIIKDTVTPMFTDSFNSVLLPVLEEKYGEALTEIQMYEDYLGDGFVAEGEFYYPLTLIVDGDLKREWIKWRVTDKKSFEGGVPYSYVGRELLQFELCYDVPTDFEERLTDRASYFEGGCVTLNIESPSSDKTFLVGKYSQTFIDEMTRQLTREIERAFSVSGLSESGVELHLIFAPGTYMEHVLDNVTYRRLLITARACSARDLWIKWTRTDGAVPFTVSDNVNSEEISFELGEDVPQKVREKEYRFLVSNSADKYQSAMGRKNITEWRDMIKRVIKRGELTKHEVVNSDPVKDSELAFKLQEVLVGHTSPREPVKPMPEFDNNSDIASLLKNVLGAGEESVSEEEYIPEILAESELSSFESELNSEEPKEIKAPEEAVEEISEELTEESYEEEKASSDSVQSYITEDELRRRIEAEIREKLELEAKVKAEAEAESLRRAHEELKAENERLLEIARRAEEERLAAEAERIAEAEKLRIELEARERAEAREKERMAEAARLALLEQQRLLEAQRLREEEEERLRAERQRAEEEARIAEARRAEEERIRLEMARRAEQERVRAEEEERQRNQEKVAGFTEPTPVNSDYTYVSKNARLLFRAPIDPNVTKRIHEIILTTIKYFHKENVYIKIKATVPDATTVNLHFEKIPEEETELLINIIKVLGKSGLGITKVILE